MLGLFVSCLWLSSPSIAQDPPTKQKAGDKFQRLTVLQEMPADQMGRVMNIMSEALGVGCGHCHQGNDFAAEGNPLKDTAREMLTMTLKLNQEYFHGRTEISCVRCHQGRSQPASLASLSFPLPMGRPNSASASGTREDIPIQRTELAEPGHALPTSKSIIVKWKEKLSTPPNQPPLTELHLKGRRVEPHGGEEEEVLTLGETHYRLETRYGPEAIIREGWSEEDRKAWKQFNEAPIPLRLDEAALIRRERLPLFGQDLLDQYSQFLLERQEHWQGSPAWKLVGQSYEGFREEVYFEVDSGNLVRRTLASNTILGPCVTEVEYHEYQAIEGVMMPTRIEYRLPGMRWTRRVEGLQAGKR